MDNKTRLLIGVLTVFPFLVCINVMDPAAQSGDPPRQEPIAAVAYEPGGVTFQPRAEYPELTLRVSAPGGSIYKNSFQKGTAPFFFLPGDAPDGSYTYELRAAPVGMNKMRRREAQGEDKNGSAAARGDLVQTGYFLVQEGVIATQSHASSEAIVPMDHVIADNLITRRVCAGEDCADGESWPIYTDIKIKSDTPRFVFEDTGEGGWPTNDWDIHTSSFNFGGAEYFAVEDMDGAVQPVFILEAGAPGNSLYVDDNGRLGLRTAVPEREFHIVSGNTPTVRLEQDRSEAHPQQEWELAGNDINFYVKDVTNIRSPFRIQPGAPNNSLLVKSNGNVGIGTSNPKSSLEIRRKRSAASCSLVHTEGATARIAATGTSAQFGSRSDHPVQVMVNNVKQMQLNSNGTLRMTSGARCTAGGAWLDASSREYKANIQSLTAAEAMQTLQGLSPVKFTYKVDATEKHVGFVAEDVPGLVASGDRKGMSPMDVVAVLTKVVQEQQKTIERQQISFQKSLLRLNEKIAELESRLR